ncbi:hypothetical protein AVEN_36362-1 [Araneus ventricosus]|uniref:Uncharacterized protein n=1 Tax=Araneus ventricosus TaxID=182803 RepID=A0A4Y2GCL9_ARAVE|nr:hypothetical protein AVEN_36362-1 [Araneus ventricosus]
MRRGSNVLQLVWGGSFERRVQAQVSSSDHGSKLRGPSQTSPCPSKRDVDKRGLQNDQALCNKPGSNLPGGLQNGQALSNKPGSNLPGGLQNDLALCNKPDYLISPTTYALSRVSRVTVCLFI